MGHLKILHLNTERSWRGGEALTLDLMDGLRDRGHVNHLATASDSPIAARSRERGHTTFEMRIRGEFNPLAIVRLACHIHRENYDITHCHTPHTHSTGGFAAWLAGCPLRVVNKRTDFSIYRNGKLGMNWLKYVYLTDQVIADSKSIERSLLADGIPRDHVEMVYEGIDLSSYDSVDPARVEALRREFEVPNGAPVIGNVAHCIEHKGQIDLIDAVPHLLEQVPNAVVFVVGEGKLLDGLRARARELGVDRSVRFTGFRKDVPDFMQLFDVFVMSSHDEGLCTSIMAAHYTRTPVVATDVGGIPEVVEWGEHGVLVPPHSPRALADGITEQLAQPEAARAAAERGRQLVEARFTRNRMAEGTLAVYRRLFEERYQRSFSDGAAPQRTPAAAGDRPSV